MPSEDAPEWFRAFLAAPVERASTSVGGVEIAYTGWGEPSPDDLVLVHGEAANSHWWDHIGPLLPRIRPRFHSLDKQVMFIQPTNRGSACISAFARLRR